MQHWFMLAGSTLRFSDLEPRRLKHGTSTRKLGDDSNRYAPTSVAVIPEMSDRESSSFLIQ